MDHGFEAVREKNSQNLSKMKSHAKLTETLAFNDIFNFIVKMCVFAKKVIK